MKKVLRTKLVYNCNKREDFDHVTGKYITCYDRSYDMVVTASTEEECKKLMDSFEIAIACVDIQNSFESNVEPNFDVKKKLWVGIVEVYVGNTWVTDEKQAIKEVYAEWKEDLKNPPLPKTKSESYSDFLIHCSELVASEFSDMDDEELMESVMDAVSSLQKKGETLMGAKDVDLYDLITDEILESQGCYNQVKTTKEKIEAIKAYVEYLKTTPRYSSYEDIGLVFNRLEEYLEKQDDFMIWKQHKGTEHNIYHDVICYSKVEEWLHQQEV